MFCNVPEFFRTNSSLNGKPTNFKEKIIAGSKIHVLKLDQMEAYKPGMFIVLNHSRRMVPNDVIQETTVVSTQRVEIIYERTGVTPLIFIDKRRLGIIEILCLAANEGFATEKDFFQVYSKSKIFKLIHWTDFSYDGNLKRLQEVNDRHKAFNQM